MWFSNKNWLYNFINLIIYIEKFVICDLKISSPIKEHTIIVTKIMTMKSHKTNNVFRISLMSLLIARKKKRLLFCISLKIRIIFKEYIIGFKGPSFPNKIVPSEISKDIFTKMMTMISKSNF